MATMTRVDEHSTRSELAEALTNMAHTAARMPAHWVDRRAAIHHDIDDLLTLYELAEA